MITLIRNADGSIKTYSEVPDTMDALAPGESLETIQSSFVEYSQRLVLTCMGKTGETVFVPQSSGDVIVEVLCPGETSVSLDINGTIEPLPLVDGKAALFLGTSEPGIFIIRPADTRKYCPAGQSILVIQVVA